MTGKAKAFALDHLGLRLRVFLFFAALGLGAVVLLGLGLGLGYRRLGSADSLNAFVQAGVIGSFGVLGLTAGVWYLFDVNVSKPIDLLAGALRARAHASVDSALDQGAARYLGDLAPAAQATALTLSETRNALAEAVARETTRLSAEKDRLAALLSDVPVGVILCSGDHQLVFYNGTAVDLIGADQGPGLDRNLFDYLREGPIRHAHRRLIEAEDADAASDLLCATRHGAEILAARMRLLPDDSAAPGYVLTLRDVTADLAAHAKREALLADVLDRIRRPAANLRALLSVLPEGTPPPAAMDVALRAEAESLTATVTDLAAQQEEGRAEAIPRSPLRVADIADSLRAKLEAQGLTLKACDVPLLLRGDGFEVVGLLARLATGVAELHEVREFALTVEEDSGNALLRLCWDGAPLLLAPLEGWLDSVLDADVPGVTGRHVLMGHATEIWPETDAEGRQAICLPLRIARRSGPRPKPIARAVVYDFDLLGKARNEAVADTALSDLTYVVFDTETTGLLPAQGDEIVQIAAVRIVNGKRVASEVFDTLVNPGRSIPAASTVVHGITEAMVQDAPDIGTVGRAFHRFAQGAVLIAHNAPFDMEFLRRNEASIGATFDNPILDTVLLSAVVFGQHEDHSLDALTHRLSITIPEEARHTAIGDTVATADAFLKLLPMLKGRELNSFGDVLAEMRRHGRLLKDLN
ncbi:DNA polymerase III subunit epsilon [Pseudorhodobacter turbinis]|uniref:DNA-directed DNA polymerase n=1 Tax=Pseudorhodobacter turbinis TaxID=2500533 RepID=A0A4P8EEM7_9RHOB|nr:exonuclease domain-containing protein [Pseudorhodobacter turbinis]QCO55207.1 DNA polymerase III subunit epsilon [Pseudorhodobacter turbinis]